jgi:hypothetical protein
MDGHSLYVEALGELGIVGLALALLTVLTLLVGIALRLRRDRRSRPLYAAVLAVSLAWALHAGVDWDWEMPAVTAWLFALGGLALAAGGRRRWTFSPGSAARVAISLGLVGVAITPALAAISQHYLNRSVAAFKHGDCAGSIDAALNSISAASIRPEPWELLGYCDARLGRDALAVRAFENAIERDRRNWQLHYGLALVRGAARRDPFPAARQALRLNPHDPLTQNAVERFRSRDPAAWEHSAKVAPLPIP